MTALLSCPTCGHAPHAGPCSVRSWAGQWRTEACSCKPSVPEEGLLLDLGCGTAPLPGYVGVDRKSGGEVFPLPYADGVAAVVRASHVLEHFPHGEVMAVLQEWVRVLQPGGMLRVAVPDFDKIVRTYLSGTPAPVEGWVMGGQTDENDFHRSLFTRDTLTRDLERIGLTEIREWQSEQQDCASLSISLNLEGRKTGGLSPTEGELGAEYGGNGAGSDLPGSIGGDAGGDLLLRCGDDGGGSLSPSRITTNQRGEIVIPKGAIAAVLSAPRVGFLDNMFCAQQHLPALGIPFTKYHGAYWNQSMANLLRGHLEDGTELVLSLDYDTVFTREALVELIRVMVTHPEIDALCAVQARREKDSPLFTVGGFEGTGEREVRIPLEVLRAETMPISSGHFGFTLHRVSALRRLPLPWLHAKPGETGLWDEGRRDADVSHWAEWTRCGNTLHLANHVIVGHLQLMVSWPNEALGATHQYVGTWNETGTPPAGVWR